MERPLLLGIDVGTSSLKALVTDGAGTPIASASASYGLSTPRPGWSEQDPEAWVQACAEAVPSALARAAAAGHPDPGRRLAAIGLSGQMHGATFVDREDRPLRPCILWNDSRSASECDRVDHELGRETVLARTGNRMLPGFTAPKVRWLQRHEAELWRRTDCILLPKDYLRLRLGSRRATDAADASGTLLFDVAARRWSTAMLADLGIDPAQVPECHESTHTVDRLSDDAARRLSLVAGTPLVAGAGDQAAAAVGAGITAPGSLSAVLGTSGVLFASSDSFRASPDGALHAFCHALPGRWHLMSVMLSAGGSMQWFLDNVARDAVSRAAEAGCTVHEWIDREASAVPPGCDGAAFVPTLAGERCPVPDPLARGAFTGMSLSTTQAHLARAVMEGVALSMARCLDLIRGAGIDPREAVASGGGFRSALWAQMHADAFGIPLRVPDEREGSALGAAILSGIGIGTATAVRATGPARSVEPDPLARGFWDRLRHGAAGGAEPAPGR